MIAPINSSLATFLFKGAQQCRNATFGRFTDSNTGAKQMAAKPFTKIR
jgi:hypothetical protein